MKTAKRILSLLLMIALLMGLSTVAFATNGAGAVDPGSGAFGEFSDDSDRGGGSTSVSRPAASKKVTLTFETNGGTQIESITVTSGTTVDLSDYITERDNYTFDGWYSDSDLTLDITKLTISKDMTIYAGWEKVDSVKNCPRDHTCPMYGYIDLDMTTWYHDGVHFCIENGLMGSTSTSDLIFEPNMTTTRAMIVTILWRLEGEPVVSYPMSFEDVADNMWYTESIRWAQSTGIVEGYSEASFGPNDIITREQLATIMWRYAKNKGYDVSSGDNISILAYGDASDISEWALTAIQWACDSGLIQGIADGAALNLAPQGNATRAQVATILYRFCESCKDE